MGCPAGHSLRLKALKQQDKITSPCSTGAMIQLFLLAQNSGSLRWAYVQRGEQNGKLWCLHLLHAAKTELTLKFAVCILLCITDLPLLSLGRFWLLWWPWLFLFTCKRGTDMSLNGARKETDFLCFIRPCLSSVCSPCPT